MKSKVKKVQQVEDDWCDDCAVCAFMRESEKLGRTPTASEMTKVFAEQNRKNAIQMLKEATEKS